MGNEEAKNPDNFYMCINMIGKEMQNIVLSLNTRRPLNTHRQNNNYKNLYDYWDYFYYPNLSIKDQIDHVFKKFNKMKGALDLNFRESLIVRLENINSPELKDILEKINNINREHYMPMVLFLFDEYDETALDYTSKKVVPDEKLYPKIDKRMIFTEGFKEIKSFNILRIEKKPLDENIIKKVSKIKRILIRFCSYHNELGDYFKIINSSGNEINYSLIEKEYDFTSNFCCIGRFGKGKSTGVNCLLGEKKAKESRSGTATTKKINYYFVKNCPIKIIDIPGFESKETVNNAIQKFREFGEKMKNKSSKLTAILYFVKSTDERMFAELEFKMFKEILKHDNVPIIYILTHSSLKTDREEIYDMLNTGIKGVLNKHPEEEPHILQKITKKMHASEDNCVFVNFYPEDDEPIFGIDEYFGKVQSLCI
jgi:GTP-binding protein EngB required for normal cell division